MKHRAGQMLIIDADGESESDESKESASEHAGINANDVTVHGERIRATVR